MHAPPALQPSAAALDRSIFTIIGGTTVPDRAALVRAECHEGSRVELRRAPRAPARARVEPPASGLDVWLECRAVLGLVRAWKKIGHVPDDLAAELLAGTDASPAVVAHGVVKSVYAPVGRDEAVVTVEIGPQVKAQAKAKAQG